MNYVTTVLMYCTVYGILRSELGSLVVQTKKDSVLQQCDCKRNAGDTFP